MPITLSPEDVEFLKKVQELGETGLAQGEIAAQIGMNPSTFRFRVRELGFALTRKTQVVARPQFGGKSLSELLDTGEITTAA